MDTKQNALIIAVLIGCLQVGFHGCSKPANNAGGVPGGGDGKEGREALSPVKPFSPSMMLGRPLNFRVDARAVRFAPIVYHDKDEKNFPTNVNWFLDRTSMWFTDQTCNVGTASNFADREFINSLWNWRPGLTSSRCEAWYMRFWTLKTLRWSFLHGSVSHLSIGVVVAVAIAS